MATPIVIHVLRPYANEAEYLAHERFSIEAKSMLLIDQAPLPVETPVVFDVTLGNGQRPIRAEGVVLGYSAAMADQPGGLRVRFKRYGAATKAFIDLALSNSGLSLRNSLAAPASVSFVDRPAPESMRAAPESIRAEPESIRSAPETIRSGPESIRNTADSSGVHRKAVQPVSTPADREGLLSRLRARRAG